MAKMQDPQRRKRRTREHVIADLSVNHVERVVLRCGWTVQRLNPDYGIDLVMTTYDASGQIRVQGGRCWPAPIHPAGGSDRTDLRDPLRI